MEKSRVEKEREVSGAGALGVGVGTTTVVGGAATMGVGVGVGRALGAGGVAWEEWEEGVSWFAGACGGESENAPWTSSSVDPLRLLPPRCEVP